MRAYLKLMVIGMGLVGFSIIGVLSTWGRQTKVPISTGDSHKSLNVTVSLPSQNTSQTQQNYMVLGSPSTSVEINDPLQLVAPTGLHGRLAYTFDIFSKEYGKVGLPTFLILREINDIHKNGVAAVTTRSYPVTKILGKNEDAKYNVVFDPIYSSDGRYILFKFGNTDTTGSFHLYVLDTETNNLSLVSDRSLICRQVSWSPDGNYITYIDGGYDEDGHTIEVRPEGEFYSGPLELYVCNWRTHQEHLILWNDTVPNSLAWTAPHTLICGILSEIELKKLQKSWHSNDAGKTSANEVAIARPDIHEYSVDTGKLKLLIKDGYRPTTSPDGKWIAFFGSADTQKPLPLKEDWMEQPGGAYLTVAQVNGSERTLLNLEKDSYPYVVWEPDNRHIITMARKDADFAVQTPILEWNVETKRFRQVALLKAKEMKVKISGFIPLCLSPDGSYLFILGTSTLGERDGNSSGYYMTRSDSILAVNLRTGLTSHIAHLKNDWGLSWQAGISSVK